MVVKIPSSKSLAHRYLIAAGLSDTPCEVVVDGWSDDLKATRDCLAAMKAGEPLWPCRESGTTLRLLTPIAAVKGWRGTFRKEGRLAERPEWPFERKGRYVVPGNISSQFVSGLLFALPLADWDSEIAVEGRLESAPYVAMTERVLAEAGVAVTRTGDLEEAPVWQVRGRQTYRLSGRVVVDPDRDIAEFYRLIFDDEWPADVVDCREWPDSVPVLAAKASVKPGVTRFVHGARLRLKESDRLAAACEAVNDAGGRARVEGDDLVVEGVASLGGGCVRTRHDHRLVMAAAVMRAFADGPVTADDPACVAKSFPDFLTPRIFLYGPPGAGKTTLGRRLAEELKRPFVDLDAEIVAEARRSVPEIFAAEGEAGFRRREKRMLKKVVCVPGAVIALGGGTLLDAESAALARETGEIRLLDAAFETLWARVSADASRPLARDREAFRRLYEARKAHYESFRT